MAKVTPRVIHAPPSRHVVHTAAVTAGDWVTHTIGSGVTKSADGGIMFGVALTSGAVGEYVEVLTQGEVEATASSGVNFAVGADCYIGANNEVDAGSTGNKSVGIVCQNDPASGGKVQILLQSSHFFANTTHA